MRELVLSVLFKRERRRRAMSGFAFNAEFAKTKAACENNAAQTMCASSCIPLLKQDTGKVSLFAFLSGVLMNKTVLAVVPAHRAGKAVAI